MPRRVRSSSFSLFCLCALTLAAMTQTVKAETPSAVPTSQRQVMLSYAPLVKLTAPSVVNIYTSKLVRQRVMMPFMDDPIFEQFFGRSYGLNRQRMENSLGSGVIVRGDGLVVTSAHVIQGADEIRVVLADRREFSAQVRTLDKKTDLAVLKIEGLTDKVPALELADSDAAEVGDLVLAIGNPFGVGQTVTTGIVSALARTGVEINDLNYFIQTDAAINPGNSGGALVGMDGRLLGVNAAIYSRSGGNMGIGFAVPASMVRAVVDAVEQGKKRVVRPWLGIDGQNVTPELANSLGLERPAGVLVNKLRALSPLAEAGLRIGDVIVSLNDKPIDDVSALRFRSGTLPIGSQATLKIQRAGKAETLTFALMAPPENPPRQETTLAARSILAGVRVANLSPALAEELGIDEADSSGVVVLSMRRASPFGLELIPGDQIVALNNTRINSVAALQELLQMGADRWLLQIKRADRILTFVIGN